jgi:hypothetical protein
MKVAIKNSLLLKERYILSMKVERYSMVPKPFLMAKRFGGKIELDSSYQSSLVLSMNSKTLHREEDKAIGRNNAFEFDLGMGITL